MTIDTKDPQPFPITPRDLRNGDASPNGHPSETQPKPWTAEDSAKLYGIKSWGQGYFSVNNDGHVAVHPSQNPAKSIDLKKLVDELRERDIQLPVLVRFTDILKHRVDQIHDAFAKAIRDHDFKGNYQCLYPIKVNQQRHVVEEIAAFGKPYGFGLEAGSKPELLAVMAVVDDDKTPIVCNGFKDDEFIEAVILATKIGRNIIPVVEKFSELELIVKYAKIHNVRPSIGVRVKLAARGAGRWESSGGVRSKFGLFISEVIEALEYLRKNNMGDCLSMLHFHLGSQINNIRNIKAAIIELVRVYVELQRMGAGLKMIDVGGGLGVDYDGSKTNFESSINYGLQEYANDVVFHVKEICDQAGVAHPTILSESGRAMVAYHSVLVFNVVGWSGFARFDLPTQLSVDERSQMPAPVVNLFDTFRDITEANFAEYYHDAQVAKDAVLNLFNLGYCSLEHRSVAERLFFGVCSKVLAIVRRMEYIPEEFAGLEATLSDTYFCNYSIFQSMPDSWAIDQLFPIMPIHRLTEEPSCRGILADITCDSDGKVDRFIDRRDVKPVLELHPFNGDSYLIAAFLVGAYQEILGDLHNLLGDTNAVHVSVDDDGHVSIDVPEGEQMFIYDASVKYQEEGTPLLILAGKEYGSGSSRDWAAKGVKLLGVTAVIAESFERIHRTNLVGMGVLPLQYVAGQTAASLKLTGKELFHISGVKEAVESGARVSVKAVAADGTETSFEAVPRVDTPQEAEYFRNGGILPFVLRQLAAA